MGGRTGRQEATVTSANHERTVHNLEKVLETVKAMTVEKDLDRLLALIISSITDVVDAERSSLFLYDEKHEELYSRIAEKSEIGEIRFPVGRGLAGEAAAKLCAINVEDAYEDPRFNREFDELTGLRTESVLCRPLQTHEGRLIGVIQALNSRKGRFDKGDEELLDAFSTHAAIALDNARLIEEHVRQREIEQALALARRIQQGLFPDEAPRLEGFDLAGVSIPADDTGGDYYDYIPASEGRWVIVVGDVTGHGIGPALLGASTRSYLRALINFAAKTDPQGLNPGDLIAQLNSLLAEDLLEGRFITMMLALLDPALRRLTYASAGHESGLYLPAGSDTFALLEATGVPLGIIKDYPSEDSPSIHLAPGDLVVFTTDGIGETFNPQLDPFGHARLKRILLNARGRTASAILDGIKSALVQFRADARQADDLTIVALRALRS